MVLVSTNAFIGWPYKLVLGKQGGTGVWTGPVHPNASVNLTQSDPGCPDGCLFNIDTDEGEHEDLSGQQADLKEKLKAELSRWVATAYQTASTPGYENCVSSDSHVKTHRGFLGPVCTA